MKTLRLLFVIGVLSSATCGCQSKLDDPFYNFVYQHDVQPSKSSLEEYNAKVISVETKAKYQFGEMEILTLYNRNGYSEKNIFRSIGNDSYLKDTYKETYYSYDSDNKLIKRETYEGEDKLNLEYKDATEYEYKGDMLVRSTSFDIRNGERRRSAVETYTYDGDNIEISKVTAKSTETTKIVVNSEELSVLYKTDLSEGFYKYKREVDGKYELVYGVFSADGIADTTYYEQKKEVVIERYENGAKKFVNEADGYFKAYDERGNEVFSKNKDTEMRRFIYYANSDEDFDEVD